jgi:DNA polymerase-3 subunit gamma/tau
MGQALYRKHRPKSLKEVVGQEHITDTLAQALEQGRISHAYLFTGPKGVGKTSIARILAREINGLPYTDDTPHLDIIEIDAASNRRIDEIRELRDKVYVAPVSAKYKVYIIDEVHMLTREAFNALLKTLEEPPAHVVFILATTDAHKLPETIISRTQRYNFRPVERAKVVEHLRRLAEQEKLKVTPEALELLAEHGEGSFRDSISMLDQASSSGQALDADLVHQLLGVPPKATIQALTKNLQTGAESRVIVRQLTELYDSGYQAAAIAKQLGQNLRSNIIDGKLDHTSSVMKLLAQLLEVPVSHAPDRYLEIVLLEYGSTQNLSPAQVPAAVPEVEEAKAPATDMAPVAEADTTAELTPDPPEEPQESPEPASITILDEATWPQVLQALKSRYNTLYGVVRMAQPRFIDENSLELVFAFAFHQKRLNEKANKVIITDILKQLTGRNITVEGKHDAAAKAPPPEVSKPRPTANKEIATISNIFGGAELLES